MMMPIKSPCEGAVARIAPGTSKPCTGPWVLIAIILSMAFIDGTVVNVALPALQSALPCVGDGHSMGGRGLRSSARIAAAVGRFSWRSLSRPQNLPRRRTAFYNRVVLLWPILLHYLADCGARTSRDRSGAPGARKPGHYQRLPILRPSAGRPSAPGPASRRSLQPSGQCWADGWWKMQWRWVFFINLPVAVIVIVLSLRYVQRQRSSKQAS